jgi:ABC-type enterobactin transport system permease subunit
MMAREAHPSLSYIWRLFVLYFCFAAMGGVATLLIYPVIKNPTLAFPTLVGFVTGAAFGIAAEYVLWNLGVTRHTA